MKIRNGSFCLRSAAWIASVWGWMPRTASITSTAASSAQNERSISAEKSMWPGVSMSWTRVFFHSKDTQAALTEMPLRLSTGRESV